MIFDISCILFALLGPVNVDGIGLELTTMSFVFKEEELFEIARCSVFGHTKHFFKLKILHVTGKVDFVRGGVTRSV